MISLKPSRESPYKGLIPYDERDAPYFFGREKETRLIAASLFAAPLTLLYGASGVGKSSVLRAGVMNHFRPRADLLVVLFNQWQGDPLADLKATVAQTAAAFLSGVDGQELSPQAAVAAIETLARDRCAKAKPTALAYGRDPDRISLDEYLRACAKATQRRLMVILDQFEEYSLYHPEGDAFAVEFPVAVVRADISVSFLISIREDALAKLDRFVGKIPTLFDTLRRVDHLDRAAAREAIARPIEKYNELERPLWGPISIEPDLIEVVLDQVRIGQVLVGETGQRLPPKNSERSDTASRIETPYLQLVMSRLWHEEMAERSPVLRLETLNRLDGAQRIVQTHLDAVMEKYSLAEQGIAANVFHLLVTPSGTKIAHSARDLAEYAGVSRNELLPILQRLSGGSDRILRPVAALPEQPDDPRYEIFHDRLGPAILDWRSRYLRDQEQAKVTRLEAERRRLKATLSKRDDEGLGSTIEPEVGPDVDLSAPDELLPYPPYPLINEMLQRRRLIPLLGWEANIAGREPSQAFVSGSLSLPSGRELARYLAQQIDFPSKDESNNLELVASYFAAMTDRMHLIDCLREIFDRDFPISSLHRYLASLPPLLIVTTNFDTTLERAFEDVQRPYDVLVTSTDRSEAYQSVGWLEYGAKEPKIVKSRELDIDLEKRSVIFKIFGSVFRHDASRDSLVITDSDYVDFVFRDFLDMIPPQVAEAIVRGSLLFLGWGLRDWMMRVLAHKLLRYGKPSYRSYRSWAVQHQPSPLDVELWRSLGVDVYNVDLDTFATTLPHAASETDH